MPASRRLLAIDVGLAALFLLISVFELSHHLEDGPYLGPLARSYAVDVLFCATLVLRRSWPRACLVLAYVVWLVPALVAYHIPLFFGSFVPMLLVGYTVARYTTGWSARAGAACGVVFWLGMLPHVGSSRLHLVINPVLTVGLGLLAWLIGTLLRRYAEQQSRLASAYAALAVEQKGREQRAAERERARIAFDMHDTVANAVSLMVVQIGNARMGLESSGEQLRLRDAERVGRDALVELRRSLGVLRGSRGPEPVEAVAVTSSEPAPTSRGAGRVLDRVPPLVADTLLAAVFAGVAVFESVDVSYDDGFRAGPVWLNVVLGVLTAAPLAWRRRNPQAAYVAMLAVLVLPGLVAPRSAFLDGTLLPLSVACFTLSRRDDGWLARTTWAASLVMTLGSLRVPEALEPINVVFGVLFTGAAWATGRATRRFDLQRAELATTLGQLAAEQADREDAAVDDERNRIAAEMHDVVAHAVSSMVVQVGAARMHGGSAAELAKLTEAEVTGRRALEELRTTLGLLRTPEDAVLRPLPGLDELDELAAGFRGAGLQVSLEVEVSEAPSEGVALTAYRILQEALTNALKHGGPGPVEARVTAGPGSVAIRVANPLGGSPHSLPSGGHGLAGMRERAAVYAGRLSAGPQDGCFVVEAQLSPETAVVAT